VHLQSFELYRRGTLLITPVLFLVFAVSVDPSRTFAQNQPAAQQSGPATTAPASPSQPKPAAELPEGDGKAIATEYCQDCHKLSNLTASRKTPDDWHDTVQTMMDRGARLPQDKFDILVQYLAKNFGPHSAAPAAGPSAGAAPSSGSPGAAAAQPPKSAELPDGEGKAIATEFCQDCHKLSNLTASRKTPDDWHDTVQTMMDRGARIPQDKVDTLVGYLAKNFGPKAGAPAPGHGSSEGTSAPTSPSNH